MVFENILGIKIIHLNVTKYNAERLVIEAEQAKFCHPNKRGLQESKMIK